MSKLKSIAVTGTLEVVTPKPEERLQLNSGTTSNYDGEK